MSSEIQLGKSASADTFASESAYPAPFGDVAGQSPTEIFRSVHGFRQDYYARWIHDAPITIDMRRDEELHEIQRVLYACAEHYVEHYREWLDLVPHDDLVLETLEYCERYAFRAGTYRPDILLCKNGDIRVCEITSRFFGNGYFLSFFYDEAARAQCEEAGVARRSYMSSLLDYFADMADGQNSLVVLKSADRSDSIRLYVPFFEALGLKATVLEADQVAANASRLEGALVLSALNQTDLAALPPSIRHLMADVGCRNDFRSIYLLHDKRFFRLFQEDGFTGAVLDDRQAAFLRTHTVPTYLPNADAEMFEKARRFKDGFIMKHRCLGKSEQVFAGRLCTPAEWDGLFERGMVENMILQPFQEQRTFPAVWEGRHFDEYVCGSMLTVDDRYFGPGIFRSSSCPVINKVDDRKFAHVLTDQAERFKSHHVL